MSTSTGYGPSTSGRPIFDGNEERYELWEVKFLGHLRIQKLHDAILPENEGGSRDVDADKNAEAFAELSLSIDDRSLSLILRDAKNDGRKALSLLRAHYLSRSETRVIGLYMELTSLRKDIDENLTDYIVRGETAAAQLRNTGETISDNLLIAMILKGLPSDFQSFVTVTTQRKEPHNLASFKEALRTYEETMKACDNSEETQAGRSSDNVMTVNAKTKCYNCGKLGHMKYECKTEKRRRGRWCSYCKSDTHNTQECRKKPKGAASKAKAVKDGAHLFCFKVTSKPPENTVPNNAEGSDLLLIDTGATSHFIRDKSKFVSFDENFDQAQHFIELADGKRQNNIAEGRGKASIKLVDSKGKEQEAFLEDALYVPSFKQNIFSVQRATEKGCSVEFQKNGGELKCPDSTVFNIQKHGKLYYLNSVTTSKIATHSLRKWHEILGHCNVKDVLKLQNVVEGMKISDKEFGDCSVCIQGKMVNETCKLPDARAKYPLQFVHVDVSGPIEPTAREGFRYTLCFTDDFSGLLCVYLLKNKSDVTLATRKYLADMAPYGKVKKIRSDNGGEFVSREFKDLMIENQIKHETSAPRSPHQNGTAERQFRTIFEMARCLLLESKLPKYLWSYAVVSACYTRNRCFSTRLGKTPFEAFCGIKPNVSNMQPFGTLCFAYVEGAKKLEARSREGIFLGYDKYSPAYLVYHPNTKKVSKVRNVRFVGDFKQEIIESDVLPENKIPSEEDNSVKDKIDRNEGASNKSDESQISENCEKTEKMYPDRERNKPKYLDDYVTCVSEQNDLFVDYCYVCDTPQNYSQAINCENVKDWCDAMNSEIESLKQNKVFEITRLPPGKSLIGGKWVYTTKVDAEGNSKCKARYVAKGYAQREDIDYTETFSPTAHMTSVRMLVQNAVDNDMSVHQMDVKTAYLNAPIDCELYIEQPQGYEVTRENGDKLVWKLEKSLYGLKQSGRNWNNLLHSFLVDEGFEQSVTDPCLYKKCVDENVVLLLFWVDDILVSSNNQHVLNDVKLALSQRFKMKDLGELRWFLGIEFNRQGDCIVMSQKSYCETDLIMLKMTVSK